MKKVINVFKPVSFTPLQIIERLRNDTSYSQQKLGYAGRLDPMASGVLLVLVGEENKKRKEYERLGKEYEFEVMFGVSSDTYDVMGRIRRVKKVKVLREEIEKVVLGFMGKWKQEYPPYSSALVKGKPLYWWARSGKMPEMLPAKMVEVKSIKLIDLRKVTLDKVVSEIVERIQNTKGEFRQEEIIFDWLKLGARKDEILIAKIRVECSSGLYVRGIANVLGEKLGVPALCYSICRTRVGRYGLSSAVRIDSINEQEL